MTFRNRAEAGTLLADCLLSYQDTQPIVYSLPRGGVVLGAMIAQRLRAPHDLLLTRKIGHPLNPEYAIGAIAEEGEPIWNQSEIESIDKGWLTKALRAARQELRRRRLRYLKKRPIIDPKGRIAILVDDGVATGYTLRAALRALRTRRPAKIVVAVPVVPADIAAILRREADAVIALLIPDAFLGSVSRYYDEFPEVSDNEVQRLLTSKEN